MSSPRIIDRRSGAERLASRLWSGEPWPPLRFLERTTASLLHRNMCRRVSARGDLPDTPLRISIGNLALGGTGKTPLTIALAADLTARGITTAILTRGYGSTVTDATVVDAGRTDLGDEARMMAEALPGCPVVQATRRVEGLALLDTLRPRPRVLIIEDGHQTKDVARHVDAVILDGEVDASGVLRPTTGATMPWGPWREDRRGAERAAIWLIENEREDIRGEAGHEVVVFRRRLSMPEAALRAAREPWGLFSGIGTPQAFETAATAEMGAPPRTIVRFGDHHSYDERDIEFLLATAAEAGICTWLTTAKDEIKLREFPPDDLKLIAVPLTVEWRGSQTLPDLVGERLRGG